MTALQTACQRLLRLSQTVSHGIPAATRAFADARPDDRTKLINKTLYRSKQRGWLELDLLMGLWAEQNVPAMSTEMLQQYSAVLDQENPDLYKWLTGQLLPPEDMRKNAAYKALSEHVAKQMAENVPAAAYAAPGKEWVRGWDDGRNKQPAAGSS